MSIEIHNLRTEVMPDDPRHVYVGRAMPRRGLKGSPLRNRYRVEDYPRDMALRLYKTDFVEASYDSAMKQEFRRLVHLASTGDLHLWCWCCPALCHADVIKAEIERRLGVVGR